MASTLFAPAPEPKTALGRHRILSPTAGIRVSPLQLGAMSVGGAWSEFMGAMDKEQSFKLLDAFVECGGNMIDSANNYQDEESERFIGEWMKERGNRDNLVIATKYTTNYRTYDLGKDGKSVQYSGNSKKSLHLSLRDSLKKLGTEYVDILYLHWWDWTTSIEEVMHSLDVVVKQGKVLYLGISDTPAWIVSAANTYAREKGLTPFSVYQGRWNLMDRAFERDIIPMARHFGMALAPWNVLAAGHLQSKKQLEERKANGESLRSMRSAEQSEDEVRFSELLLEIAGEHNIESVTAIALAYVMSKTPYVFPIVGGRKVEHLHDNIQALSIKLTPEQIKKIEDAKSFEPGFPHDMIGGDSSIAGVEQGWLLKASGALDLVTGPQPL